MRIFAGENAKTDPILTPGTVQKSMFIDPAGVPNREAVEMENLKSVGDTAPCIFEGCRGKTGRPGLDESSPVGIMHTARQDPRKTSVFAEPQINNLFHTPLSRKYSVRNHE